MANKIARLLKDGTTDLADLLDRAIALKESEDATTAKKRKPGRFKGKLIVGPEFFKPLSDDELKELTGE